MASSFLLCCTLPTTQKTGHACMTGRYPALYGLPLILTAQGAHGGSLILGMELIVHSRQAQSKHRSHNKPHHHNNLLTVLV